MKSGREGGVHNRTEGYFSPFFNSKGEKGICFLESILYLYVLKVLIDLLLLLTDMACISSA